MLFGMTPATKVGQFWLDAQERGLGWLTQRARAQSPRHLLIGLEGEQVALFWLRRQGVVIVARRWTTPRLPGDVDLIGWDYSPEGVATLCFFEVKTRTARDMTPAESQVDDHKRRTLRSLARAYLRSFPAAERANITVRFDVVSVYLLGGAPEIQHFPSAFCWR